MKLINKRFALTFAAVATCIMPGVASATPKIENAVAPKYPRAAERRNIEGAVRVRISVDASGAVSGVQVVEANPAGVFDNAAVKAVEQWSFVPGEAGEVEKNIKFQLTD